jgi:hypothetical protein
LEGSRGAGRPEGASAAEAEAEALRAALRAAEGRAAEAERGRRAAEEEIAALQVRAPLGLRGTSVGPLLLATRQLSGGALTPFV